MLPNAEILDSNAVEISLNAEGDLTYTMHLDEEYKTCIKKLSQVFATTKTRIDDIIPQIVYYLWRTVGEKKLAKKVKAKFNQVIKTHDNYFDALYVATILSNAISISTCKQFLEANGVDSEFNLDKSKLSEYYIKLSFDCNGKTFYSQFSYADYETCIQHLSKSFVKYNVDCLSVVPQIIYYLWDSIGKEKLAQKVKAKFCPNMIINTNDNSFESLVIANILTNALMDTACNDEDASDSTDEAEE